jgi:small subunit ribosomal protein S8
MLLANVCSTLTNSSKRGQRLVSIPFSNASRSIADILYQQGLISSWQMGDQEGPFLAPVKITPENDHLRKIWIHLKYRQGEPALKQMSLVSKPSRRIYASVEEIQALASAKRVSSLIKRQVLGQITILETKKGILELQDAVQAKLGGEVLLIAY